jgi:hypothetical protein
VPLGLANRPSAAEQSQTATASGASSIKKKENLKKRSFFINHTRLFFHYSPTAQMRGRWLQLCK